MKPRNCAIAREKAGNTVVFAAIDGTLAGLFSIADQSRGRTWLAEMPQRHQTDHHADGGNRHTAQRRCGTINLDAFHAELLPEDKCVSSNNCRQMEPLCDGGDGINDAPAITADISLAMGERQDRYLHGDGRCCVDGRQAVQFSHAYSLSKATIRNMKQNIAIAVAVVIFLLAGVLMRSVHLASSMFILSQHPGGHPNAMRLIGSTENATAPDKIRMQPTGCGTI
jgi:Cd2+/Zn2+-exporting ATPase